MGPYYVTTAIPYVNVDPHLGFALELVQADVLARFHRLRGDDTRFLTGTDENSLTNVLAAERAGVPVRDLVDRNAERFRDLTSVLRISNDDFLRTATDSRHIAGVRRFWEACAARGDVYRRAYRGLYCVRCESFFTPDELLDGRGRYEGPARKARNRRATSGGLTVGRPSLASDPGAIRTWIRCGPGSSRAAAQARSKPARLSALAPLA
jgi:methionyl-tRNA synthetase